VNVTQAQKIVSQFSRLRIAVVGDLMLDRYIWGHASRISQEAPVPVVAVDRQSMEPGGAANVLRNLTSLGARASAFGVIGDDTNGADLCAVLEAQGVDTSGIHRDPYRTTTEKTRIIANHQQVVRVDTEKVEPLDPSATQALCAKLSEAMTRGDINAIIVEDYAKGTVNETLLQFVGDSAHKHDIPVALDPHPGSTARAQGYTVITPNRAEAFAMAGVYEHDGVLPIEGDHALLAVVQALQEQWSPQHLLITLGADGMALFSKDGAPHHIPTQAREVYDVSGAGDTVIASFLLALATGAAPEEAAAISNHAAGVVVAKVGTAPVTAQELLHAFEVEE
jgi:D-glycero-beta-D-manno-heptose-7-phosphate kinase